MKEEIYEPSFEKEVLDGFKEDEVSMAIAGVFPTGVSPLKAVPLFDLDRVNKLIEEAMLGYREEQLTLVGAEV